MNARRYCIFFILLIFSESLIHGLPAQSLRYIYPPPEATAKNPVYRGQLQKLMQAAHSFNPNRSIIKPRGQWHALVILVDFPDYPWYSSADSLFNYPESLFTRQYFQDMLFSVGKFKDPLSQSEYTGSMRDFYRETSYGIFDIDGIVTAWVRADHSLKYYVNSDGLPSTYDDYGYGNFPQNVPGLVTEVVNKVDSAINFTEFDNTGDGNVDALFIVHSGPGAEEIYTTKYEASFGYIWSHAWSIPAQTLDGVTIKDYTIEPANGTIGVFCHEFGHSFGLPDLYDPDISSEGIGEWGLMGAGGWCHRSGDRVGTSPAHFTSWSKIKLGWVEPVSITTNQAKLVLAPSTESAEVVLLKQPWMPPGEYFLLENRQPVGFDAGLTRRQKDFHLLDPQGLLILHIDEKRGNQKNEKRRVVDVEEATPFFENGSGLAIEQLDLQRDLKEYQFLNKGNRGDNGDLFPGFAGVTEDLTDFVGPRIQDHFDDFTVPSSNTNDGEMSGIAVENITQLPDGRVSFSVKFEAFTRVVQDERPASPGEWRLSLFPNPSYAFPTIQLSGLQANTSATISIFDILGRTIGEQQIFPAAKGLLSINIADILRPHPRAHAAGVYFVRVIQGQKIMRKKFILISR